jgi:hypothetical protein
MQRLPDKRRRRFEACSSKCRLAIHAREAKRPERKRVCPVCRKKFVAPRSDAVTCSNACRQRRHRDRRID